MGYSLAAWLAEWATCDNRESYLDVFIETAEVRFHKKQVRTTTGKELRKHLFGSERAPPYSFVNAAIQAEGSATALASKLQPIIDAGMDAPYGALTAAMRESAMGKTHSSQIDVGASSSQEQMTETYVQSEIPRHIFDLGSLICNAVRQMAIDGSREGLLYGLRGTPEYLGHNGDQWESWITKDIASRTGLLHQISYPAESVQRFHTNSIGDRKRNFQTCEETLAPIGSGSNLKRYLNPSF